MLKITVFCCFAILGIVRNEYACNGSHVMRVVADIKSVIGDYAYPHEHSMKYTPHQNTSPAKAKESHTKSPLARHSRDVPRINSDKSLDFLNSAYVQALCNTGFLKQASLNHTVDVAALVMTDATVRIWEIEDGRCLPPLRGHSALINSAHFNTAGTLLVTASDDMTAKIWTIKNGQCLQTLEGHTARILSAQFNQSGEKVITHSADKTVKIWDVKTGIYLQTLKDTTDCFCAAHFNSLGNKVITVSQNGIVKIWIAETGEHIRTLNEDSKGDIQTRVLS